MPTWIAFEVIPVWSLKALCGMARPELPPLLPPPAVVAVEDELVELHATAVVATRATIPNAAMRVFHGAESKVPPMISVNWLISVKRRLRARYATGPGGANV
ncbi:MAG TPA: hypothetical protein VMV06_10735 [Acidimicrobiales bacterium]|nr:hypothetical protein [Acidimicrobiales bacterium]